MSPRLLFVDLVPDVISSILACCDISSVVATAQTCQYLHGLAFTKSLWLCLLETLRRKSILDPTNTPDIESLSTEDIIGIVRRLLKGPEVWNHPHPDDELGPVAREITLHPRTPLTDLKEVKLLPSGRYVLLLNLNQLRCWNVAEDRLIWEYFAVEEHTRLLAFAAEEPGAGDSLVIVICARTFPPAGVSENYVDIINVDLEIGTHRSLLIARCLDSPTDNPFYQLGIRGELAVVSIHSRPQRHMVINWQEHSHFIVKGLEVQIVLLHRHIMVKTASLEGEEEIHIISNESLHNLWTPTVGIGDSGESAPISTTALPKRSTFVNADFSERSFNSMHVFDSPLQDGSYRVWIYSTQRAWSRACLIYYHLTMPVDGQPTWCGPTLWSEATHRPTKISYSGLVPVRTMMTGGFNDAFDGYTFFLPDQLGEGRCTRVKLINNGGPIDVGAYSASVTYTTHSSIVIRYYE
ncbi:hypothetical protein C8R45DRAFT_1222952 [Mycena sanguinolenta]|nr:hypothetical protein C8R45DRAFT_1222952 [Mycena sanguinolenta]